MKFNGVSPVDFQVSFSLGDKGVHYRLDLVPETSQVEVTSIELKADHVSGKVIVADRFVTLREVHGRTAEGAIDLPKADLDFTKTPYDLTFDVSVKKVNLQELPKSWKIPEPPFVEGAMLLTGRADLHVKIQGNKATTTGHGKGYVDTMIFKKPTQVEVRLKADEKGFHFSTPAKTALKLLPLLAPPLHAQEDPQESAPDDDPKAPHSLAVPLDQGTEAMIGGTGALLKGGTGAEASFPLAETAARPEDGVSRSESRAEERGHRRDHARSQSEASGFDERQGIVSGSGGRAHRHAE